MHDELWAKTTTLRFLGGFPHLPSPAGLLMPTPEDLTDQEPKGLLCGPPGAPLIPAQTGEVQPSLQDSPRRYENETSGS